MVCKAGGCWETVPAPLCGESGSRGFTTPVEWPANPVAGAPGKGDVVGMVADCLTPIEHRTHPNLRPPVGGSRG